MVTYRACSMFKAKYEAYFYIISINNLILHSNPQKASVSWTFFFYLPEITFLHSFS